jgi:hypothetical protein
MMVIESINDIGFTLGLGLPTGTFSNVNLVLKWEKGTTSSGLIQGKLC